MSYPFCVNCQHYKSTYVEVAPQRMGKINICTNPDYLNVVTGTPVQCEQVRGLKEFCSLEGKGFVEKVQEALIISSVPMKTSEEK